MEAGLTLGPDRVGGVGRQQRGLNGCSRKKRPRIRNSSLPLEFLFLPLLWLRCYTVSVAILLLPFSPILLLFTSSFYFLVLPGTFVVQSRCPPPRTPCGKCLQTLLSQVAMQMRPGITTVTTAAAPRPASAPGSRPALCNPSLSVLLN